MAQASRALEIRFAFDCLPKRRGAPFQHIAPLFRNVPCDVVLVTAFRKKHFVFENITADGKRNQFVFVRKLIEQPVALVFLRNAGVERKYLAVFA